MPKVGKIINPPEVPPSAKLSQAVRVGNTIYCSGQIGVGPDGNIVGPGIEEQATRAFENLRIVLNAAGATLDDVVKMTAYLVDIDDRAAYLTVRARYIQPPYPASTLVVAKSLARPEYRFEVDVVAVVG